MSKFIKNNKGFTLVEVIVVAVIVLILAAVAIPLYNGYIRDSRKSVAESTAGSIAAAIAAQIQAQGETQTTAAAAVVGTPTWIVGPSPDVNGRTKFTINHTSSGEVSEILVPAGYTASMTAGCVIVTWVGSATTAPSDAPVGRAPVSSGVQNCVTSDGSAT